jgi:hypothetical protein
MYYIQRKYFMAVWALYVYNGYDLFWNYRGENNKGQDQKCNCREEAGIKNMRKRVIKGTVSVNLR